jgi:flagellar hook-length control protein FliK
MTGTGRPPGSSGRGAGAAPGEGSIFAALLGAAGSMLPGRWTAGGPGNGQEIGRPFIDGLGLETDSLEQQLPAELGLAALLPSSPQPAPATAQMPAGIEPVAEATPGPNVAAGPASALLGMTGEPTGQPGATAPGPAPAAVEVAVEAGTESEAVIPVPATKADGAVPNEPAANVPGPAMQASPTPDADQALAEWRSASGAASAAEVKTAAAKPTEAAAAQVQGKTEGGETSASVPADAPKPTGAAAVSAEPALVEPGADRPTRTAGEPGPTAPATDLAGARAERADGPAQAARQQAAEFMQQPLRVERVVRHDAERLTVMLDPPELGTLEIAFTLRPGHEPRAVIVVDRPETLELLQRDLPSLERSLSQAGVQVGSNALQLELRNDQQQRGHQAPNLAEGGQPGAGQGESGDARAHSGPRGRADLLVDLFA